MDFDPLIRFLPADELAGALDRFDEEHTHAVLDRLLAAGASAADPKATS